MNKQEFKAEYRKWRSVLKHVVIPEQRGLSAKERADVWWIIYSGVHKAMPDHIKRALIDRPQHRKKYTHFRISSKASIYCNLVLLPNSYPHETKNP
jgi:hypothetical protein